MSVGRDYKTKTKSGSRTRRSDRKGVGRLGLVVLLLSAVGLGAGGWHYWQQGGPGAVVAAVTPAPAPTQPAAQPVQEQPARQEQSVEKAVPPPKYSFYETLRQREVVIPDTTATPIPPPQPPKPVAPVTPAAPALGSYLVQAGAFRTPEEADQRKAMLALLGIQSRIEAGSNGLHRVRIGPLGDLDEVQALRRRLEANDIKSFAVKAD